MCCARRISPCERRPIPITQAPTAHRGAVARLDAEKKKSPPAPPRPNSNYDSADPPTLLKTALQAADWKGFAKRRRESKRRGKLRGIGLALFLEPSGGVGKEQAEIRIQSDGRLALYSNAGPSGHGHENVV